MGEKVAQGTFSMEPIEILRFMTEPAADDPPAIQGITLPMGRGRLGQS
jgi:hypothetical protein